MVTSDACHPGNRIAYCTVKLAAAPELSRAGDVPAGEAVWCWAPGPDLALERSELEEALHRAIGELPEERRIVVVLRDVEGLAYEEIAEVLELPVGTVRSRLHRARLDLKEKLERFFT